MQSSACAQMDRHCKHAYAGCCSTQLRTCCMQTVWVQHTGGTGSGTSPSSDTDHTGLTVPRLQHLAHAQPWLCGKHKHIPTTKHTSTHHSAPLELHSLCKAHGQRQNTWTHTQPTPHTAYTTTNTVQCCNSLQTNTPLIQCCCCCSVIPRHRQTARPATATAATAAAAAHATPGPPGSTTAASLHTAECPHPTAPCRFLQPSLPAPCP